MRLEGQLRVDALALAVGFASEFLITAFIDIVGGVSRNAAILFYAQAVVLGWVFGARAGMIGSAVPILVFGIVDATVFDANQRAEILTVVLFVAITLAFTAGMTGALRERYGRPPRRR